MPAPPLHYRFEWELDAPPDDLWLQVSDTERFNKVIGLPEPVFTDVPCDEGGSRRFGEARRSGMKLRWREHPYEWVSPRYQEVLRDFDQGPLSALRSRVTLSPRDGGGTHLVHELWLTPALALLAPLVRFEASVKTRRAMDRAYRRMDAMVMIRARAGRPAIALDDDPFEPPVDHIPPERAARFDAVVAGLRQRRRLEPALVDRLVDLVRRAPDHVVERIRPRPLARDWGADPDAALEACLLATDGGLLSMSWELLCPRCRTAANAVTSLHQLSTDVHCGACNIPYSVGFERSVELVFRPSPALRPVEELTYCLGSPARARHVLCQQWLPPGERRALAIPLGPGRYRLLGRPFDALTTIEAVEDPSAPGTLSVHIDAAGAASATARVRAGEIQLEIANDSPGVQTVRLDWAAWSQDAITAAEATTRAVFRDLFAAEVVAPGVQVEVGRVAVLFTDLQGSTQMYEAAGDGEAYARVRDHFEVLGDVVARHRGSVVKTIGDAIMAAFVDPADALQAALSFQPALAAVPSTAGLGIKCGLHYGPAIGATANDRLDYFGTSVNLAARLERVAGSGEVAISAETLQDPAVLALVGERPALLRRVKEEHLKGLTGARRVVVLAAGDAG